MATKKSLEASTTPPKNSHKPPQKQATNTAKLTFASLENSAKSRLQDARWLFSAGVTLCLVSLIVLGLSIGITNKQASQPATTGKLMTPYAVNTDITQGDVTARVSNVRSDPGQGMFAAPEGQHYLILTLTIHNRSDKQLYILPSSDTYVKKPGGSTIYLSPTTLDNPFHAGALLPGDDISGDLSYLVPNNESVSFYIDGIWSGGVLPITIKQ